MGVSANIFLWWHSVWLSQLEEIRTLHAQQLQAMDAKKRQELHDFDQKSKIEVSYYYSVCIVKRCLLTYTITFL